MDGACNQPGYCDFEKGDWCTWTNADREDTFDWLVGSGGTPSSYTGPSTDHTTGLFDTLLGLPVMVCKSHLIIILKKFRHKWDLNPWPL